VFTGLVRCLGTVREAAPFGKGRRFRIDIRELARNAGIGQSIAVNGVCLTIARLDGDEAVFEAVAETVSRTNLGFLKPGGAVNLEPALTVGDALDGHIVLGHIDALARVLDVSSAHADSRVLRIALPKTIRRLVAEKGSVAIDGISLTVAQAGDDWFAVTVIPHTWNQTTLASLRPGDGVNIEADVMARYAARIMQFQGDGNGLTEDVLRQNGFL
jgi:riboflavin synthase